LYEDLKYDDHVDTKPGNYPKPKGKLHIRILEPNNDPNDSDMYTKTDSELRNILANKLMQLAGSDLGLAMTNYFMAHIENKKPYVHQGSMPLAKAARSNKKIKARLAQIKSDISKALSGKVNPPVLPRRSVAPVTYFFPRIELPYTGWSDLWEILLPTAAESKLISAIGGTKCWKVFVRNLTETKIGLRYDLRLEITDHFGADETDLYSEALCALWLLQHARKGPIPFVNVLVFEETAFLQLWPDSHRRPGASYRNSHVIGREPPAG
jgi:hypothetical protein